MKSQFTFPIFYRITTCVCGTLVGTASGLYDKAGWESPCPAISMPRVGFCMVFPEPAQTQKKTTTSLASGHDLNELGQDRISIHSPGGLPVSIFHIDFNPLAPCGARRIRQADLAFIRIFQSTRPVRGETAIMPKQRVIIWA